MQLSYWVVPEAHHHRDNIPPTYPSPQGGEWLASDLFEISKRTQWDRYNNAYCVYNMILYSNIKNYYNYIIIYHIIYVYVVILIRHFQTLESGDFRQAFAHPCWPRRHGSLAGLVRISLRTPRRVCWKIRNSKSGSSSTISVPSPRRGDMGTQGSSGFVGLWTPLSVQCEAPVR